MLHRTRSTFFIPAYPPCIAHYHGSPALLRRQIVAISRHPLKVRSRRGYSTQRPEFNASSGSGSTGGIPIGKIPLGSAKIPVQKGIAIKDDITKSWKELSLPQKIVRTGAQTTNFAVIVVGIGVVGAVLYYLTVSVFLPTSETAVFSRAFERVRHDPQMKRLIGENMKAYGENSGSRWARNRQIASLHRLDPQNVDHLFMRFYVEGDQGRATVRLEMTKGEHEAEYKYRFLFVEFDPLPGFAPKRIYLEGEPARKAAGPGTNSSGQRKKGFLGIQWR